MSLTLSRPIAFIDIESTGVAPDTDRIIELAICKLHPDMSRTRVCYRFNPGCPIPAAATKVHGITNADVVHEPPFSVRAAEIAALIEGCDLGGFNSNRFDFPILMHEFSLCGISWDYKQHHMVDAGNIFKIQEQRTLAAAYKFYCDQEISNAHSAAVDIEATVDVFLAQLERYPDMPATVEEIALFSNYGNPVLDLSGKFTHNDQGQIVFNFGVKRGLIALDNMEYVDWMYHKASFPLDTRRVCEQIYAQHLQRRQNRSAVETPEELPF